MTGSPATSMGTQAPVAPGPAPIRRFQPALALTKTQRSSLEQLRNVQGKQVATTSAVVTAYMAGLALGSVFFGWWVDRWRRPLVLFALLEAGIALLAALFPVITSFVLKPTYVALYGSLGESHYVMSLARFALTFLVLLIPTSLKTMESTREGCRSPPGAAL